MSKFVEHDVLGVERRGVRVEEDVVRRRNRNPQATRGGRAETGDALQLEPASAGTGDALAELVQVERARDRDALQTPFALPAQPPHLCPLYLPGAEIITLSKCLVK